MKRIIALMAMVAIGLGFYLSPQAMQWNDLRLERNHFLEVERVADNRPSIENTQLLEALDVYNQRIWDEVDRSSFPENEAATDRYYQAQLRDKARFNELDFSSGIPTAADAMGFVSIPKISVSMPIYHGATESALVRGAGHVYGTSLPVGGPNTHTVVTAHSLQGAAGRFNRLRELEVGDDFYLTSAGRTLRYVVDEINVVLPEETEYLQIIDDADYATLLTCTPMGLNTHRLLVRGVRAEMLPTTGIDAAPLPFPYFSLWWGGGIALTGGLAWTIDKSFTKRFAKKPKHLKARSGKGSITLAPAGAGA